MKLPGQLPHTPPPPAEQQRILTLRPYVREAKECFRPTWQLGPRKLFDFLLVHFLEGAGRCTVAEKTVDVTPGDLIWIPPDTLHEMRGDTPGTTLQYIHFDLFYDPKRSHWSANIPGGTTDLSLWPKRMHPPVNDPILGSWCGKLPDRNSAFVTETLRRIVLDFTRRQSSGLSVSGQVCQLIGHLLDGHPDSSLTACQTLTMENAMQTIQRHGHEKLNIERLARQHGLCQTHFRKLFHEHAGCSPREAHIRAKMRTACDFLIYSDLTISEIADRLGFTSIHNFSRAFRKAIGQPPTAYRNGKVLRDGSESGAT